MAEMQLTTDERLKLTYEMRVPQIIELLDMSEQTLQKVKLKLYWLNFYAGTILGILNFVCTTSPCRSLFPQLHVLTL